VSLSGYAARIGCTRAHLERLGLVEEHYRGKRAVRIPYFDENGREVARRWRVALEKSEGLDQRFAHRRGDPLLLYGLWQLKEIHAAGYVVLVEGESDCHVLWAHGFPALGIPGANSYRDDWSGHLEGVERVYVVREPDQGGERLTAKLATSRLADRLFVVDLPDAGDAKELYLRDRKAFRESFESALRAARAYPEERADADAARRAELWNRCRGLAESPDILARFAGELPRVGVVREIRYAQILYLALTSRLLERPVSVAGKGPSAAGKSHVLERTLLFFPPSAYYVLSGMSEHAMAYSQEPLSHRMLVIYEAVGMESDFVSYLIRSLLSEGRIRYETVEKTSEGLRSRVIERTGPTGLLVTTTAVSLHPENETRILSVTADDSREQTQAVLLATAEGNRSAPDLEPWRALQGWLELGAREVEIPYATDLAKLIPPIAVRLRRDFVQVLNLIKSHALLHQPRRPRDSENRVVAQLEDYAAVRPLIAGVVSESVEATVSDTLRETVRAVESLLTEGAETVSIAALSQRLKLDRSAVSRRARSATQRGYLKNLETRKRQEARLVLGDPLPDDQELLPTLELLAEAVCTCAARTGGVKKTPSRAPDLEPAAERRRRIAL
jgi:hypothetical protein